MPCFRLVTALEELEGGARVAEAVERVAQAVTNVVAAGIGPVTVLGHSQ